MKICSYLRQSKVADSGIKKNDFQLISKWLLFTYHLLLVLAVWSPDAFSAVLREYRERNQNNIYVVIPSTIPDTTSSVTGIDRKTDDDHPEPLMTIQKVPFNASQIHSDIGQQNSKKLLLWNKGFLKASAQHKNWEAFFSTLLDEYKNEVDGKIKWHRLRRDAMVIDNNLQRVWFRQNINITGYTFESLINVSAINANASAELAPEESTTFDLSKKSTDETGYSWRHTPFKEFFMKPQCTRRWTPKGWEEFDASLSALAAYEDKIISVTYILPWCWLEVWHKAGCPLNPIDSPPSTGGLHVALLQTYPSGEMELRWETFMEESLNPSAQSMLKAPVVALSDSKIHVAAGRNLFVLDKLTGARITRKLLNDNPQTGFFWEVKGESPGYREFFNEPVVDRSGNFFVLYKREFNHQTLFGFFLENGSYRTESYTLEEYDVGHQDFSSFGHSLLINRQGELLVMTGTPLNDDLSKEATLTFTWFDLSQGKLQPLRKKHVKLPWSKFIPEQMITDSYKIFLLGRFYGQINAIEADGSIYAKIDSAFFHKADNTSDWKVIDSDLYIKLSFGDDSVPDNQAFWSKRGGSTDSLNYLEPSSSQSAISEVKPKMLFDQLVAIIIENYYVKYGVSLFEKRFHALRYLMPSYPSPNDPAWLNNVTSNETVIENFENVTLPKQCYPAPAPAPQPKLSDSTNTASNSAAWNNPLYLALPTLYWLNHHAGN